MLRIFEHFFENTKFLRIEKKFWNMNENELEMNDFSYEF